MTISPRSNGWQVRLDHKRRRYSVQVNGSYEEAQRKQEEMVRTLRVYGMWPAPEGAAPVLPEAGLPPALRSNERQSFEGLEGTLAQAVRATMRDGWQGMRYDGTPYLRAIASWLYHRGRVDLDTITREDFEEYVKHRKARHIAASTINKEVAAIKKVFDYARRRSPPLMTRVVELQKARPDRIAKWWLPPEQLEALLQELRGESQREFLFADFIELICMTGMRVEETLRLRVRHLVGKRRLEVPGTKTDKSQATIAIMERAEEIIRGRIRSVADDPEALLFPFSYEWAARRWEPCRGWLGVADVKTATLKALRRTFAKIATKKGMPTATLRDILRHSHITTTQGYLDLVGDEGKLEEQERWL